MITKFGVKNFKKIEDSGMIAFSDITLLVGANNSGKSSFIKALILLHDNIVNRDKSIYLDGWTFDLYSTTYNNINLGDFKRVVNDKSKVRFITFTAEFKDTTGRSRLLEVGVGSDDINEISSSMRSIRVKDVLNETDTYEFRFRCGATILIPYKDFINAYNKGGLKTFGLAAVNNPIINLDSDGNGTITIGNEENIVRVINGIAQVHVYGSTEDRGDLISSLIAGININPSENVIHYALMDEDELWETFKPLYNKEAVNVYLENYQNIEQKAFIHIEYIHAHSIPKKVFFSVDDRNDFTARTLHEAYHTNALLDQSIAGAELRKFINFWLQKFNIGDEIEIRRSEGDGYTAKIVSENENRKNLVDLGTGAAQLVLLLIKVATIIMTSKTENVLLVLEEPEQNMHPNYQTMLADLFFAIQRKGIKLLIETHSEYLIRRSQVIVAQLALEKGLSQEQLDKENPFRVIYFPEGGQPYDMHYKVNGDFENLFGEGFFDAAAKNRVELYKMQLGLNK